MLNVKNLFEKININSPILFDEPMTRHTSFKIGGPADIFITPSDSTELINILELCKNHNIPYFILGNGSNILVADDGIEGVVIDLSSFTKMENEGIGIKAQGGALVSLVSEEALECSLSGMEFIYSMPGSVGGAIWMNERCYEVSISDRIDTITFIDEDSTIREMRPEPGLFAYKKSPFQNTRAVIVAATFRLKKGDPKLIKAEMVKNKNDRESKGHFFLPSAGSVFKNNRAFGKSTGQIIDSLSLKGVSIGGAMISNHHANIIVNTGNARASDVDKLITYIEERVLHELGFKLETEVLRIGRWPAQSRVRMT
jgi:UDP-N-acetylmuramate dehydrogenase